MSCIRILSSACILLVLSAFMTHPAAQAQIRLLQTGDFHGDEVDAEDGERWMGLFGEHGGYFLQEVTIRIEPIYDAIIDNESERTGKRVTVEAEIPPLFLLRGVAEIEDGRIEDITPNLPMPLTYPGQNAPLFMDGTSTLLALGAYELEDGRLAFEGWRLVLVQGETVQTIVENATQVVESPSYVSGPILVWAGDLDGDGKPDFLLDGLRAQYNVRTSITLYLSSLAAPGDLVGQAAKFWAVGC